MVNNSWLQPIVNKLTVWRKQKLCMVSLSLCCQAGATQPGGEEIRNDGESVLTAARLLGPETLNMRTFFFADITSRLFL